MRLCFQATRAFVAEKKEEVETNIVAIMEAAIAMAMDMVIDIDI